jgi:hypothetical protein
MHYISSGSASTRSCACTTTSTGSTATKLLWLLFLKLTTLISHTFHIWNSTQHRPPYNTGNNQVKPFRSFDLRNQTSSGNPSSRNLRNWIKDDYKDLHSGASQSGCKQFRKICSPAGTLDRKSVAKVQKMSLAKLFLPISRNSL